MDDESLIKRLEALQQADGKKEPHILRARLKHVRSYILWSSNEDQILTELYKKNYTIDFVAKSLKRSNNSIEERIKFLELSPENKYKNQKKVKEEIKGKEDDKKKNDKPCKNEARSVIEYWRNSLADTEKMGLTTNKMKEGETFKFVTFKSGQLPHGIIKRFFEDDKKIKADKFNSNIEENDITTIQVIIAPYSLIKNREHGKKIGYSSPEEVLPLWIIATLTKDGKLHSAEEDILPWIERKCLTPNEDKGNALGYPIIGDVVQVDSFYLKKNKLFNEGKCLWEDLFLFADDLLQTLLVENKTIFSDQGYTLLETGYLLPSNEIIGACKNIIGTYDQCIADTSKKIPPLLEMFCSLQDQPYDKDYSINEIFIASQQHVGQMQNNHPLSLSQRISFSYLSDPTANNIFTIHGPPGTGKTSLLLSVIASKWVEAALQKKPPPIIVAASTNNLAVTNILDAFNAAASLGEHTIRWIPDFKSYGLYLVSNSKENIKKAKDKCYPYRLRDKNSGSIECLYSKNYLENARPYFLRKFNQYYKKNETNITFCQAYIHENMQEKQCLLNMAIEIIENLYTTNEAIKKHYGDINTIDNLIFKNTIEKSRVEEQLTTVNQLLIDWLLYKVTELKWLRLFSWVPFVKSQLFDKLRLFTSRYERVFQGAIMQIETIDHILDLEITDNATRLKEIEGIILELGNAKEIHQKNLREKANLEEKLGFEFSIDNIFDFGDTNNILCKLDKTLRYDLFFLATHYWEANWLAESEIYTTLNYSFEGRQKYWQIHAMLTPCFVTTLHSGPGFFQYRNSSQQFETLAEFVDLLIIDEAGQVMPALAGALISTAKKTLLVGDAKQIEPIVTLTEGIDFANAKKFGLCTNIEGYHKLKASGILCSGDSSTGHAYGNVIIVGQRKARFHLKNEVLPGMLLKEHRRCAKEIISYCNELCYDNQLIPMAQETPCIYPRMGYAHIKGSQEKHGSSRFNKLEAETIVSWIVKNEKQILATCSAKSLADCIGIVTPFSAQKRVIQLALNENNIDLDKAGTIHSLQGAEKSIIIFSPVYTSGDYQGKLFFDRSANMLNVAVSRAKMSFLVFGDMDIFDESKKDNPSSLLAKHLFSREENEIVDIIQARFTLVGDKEIQQINTLEQHREKLIKSFGYATNSLSIVSPFLRVNAIKNDDIQELIKQNSQRITINIYTDPDLNNGHLAEFNHAKSMLMAEGANVIQVKNVHSKIITIDNRIIIEGSFNWLSASRQSSQYIREESSIIYSGKHVARFIHEAMEPIKKKSYSKI